MGIDFWLHRNSSWTFTLCDYNLYGKRLGVCGLMDIWQLFWFIFAIFIVFLVAVGSFMFYHFRTYKYKVRVYETHGADWKEVGMYRARLLNISGSLGERVLWVPKLKEYLSAYGRKMGKNLFYYAKAHDGYYYNILLGDLDAKMGVLDIEPVDQDVRAFHTTNKKNIEERYNKPKNWPTIVMAFTIILALLIVFIGGYVMYDKVIEGMDKTNANIEASMRATEVAGDVLAGIDNLISGGKASGIVKVEEVG